MNNKQASSQDRFENGYFWELYKDLKSQFRNFLEYVPYFEGNEKVYSFRARANIAFSVSGFVPARKLRISKKELYEVSLPTTHFPEGSVATNVQPSASSLGRRKTTGTFICVSVYII